MGDLGMVGMAWCVVVVKIEVWGFFGVSVIWVRVFLAEGVGGWGLGFAPRGGGVFSRVLWTEWGWFVRRGICG